MIRPFLPFRWLILEMAGLCCLLLSGSLMSCTSSKFGNASADAINDNFRGPSYDDFPAEILFGFNVCIFGMAGTGKHSATSTLSAPANLLASATGLPGPMTPNAQDSFLDHVTYLYGVQLIGKGGKYFDGFGTSTSRRTYLEPLAYALYNYDLPNNKGRLFGGPGVFAAYGLWGKIKYSDPGGSESYPAFDKTAGYKRFDAGLGFMVGYQLPQEIRLSIAREWGLVNIEPGGGSDKTFSRAWSLNVAYPLQKITDLFTKK